jgi:hypothetical protein
MISMDNLLNMVATEAIEGWVDEHGRAIIPERREPTPEEKRLKPIRYDLELIEQPNGSYKWIE